MALRTKRFRAQVLLLPYRSEDEFNCSEKFPGKIRDSTVVSV